MRIEDVRNRLREVERDCFLDLPRGIGKTTELVKFAVEEEQQGKNVLFVCRNQAHRGTIRNMILRESIGSGNAVNPVEDRRVGNIFLEIAPRRRGSTRIETNFDVAIFDEYTHMDEDDINSFRLFCRRLVGLGTSRIMEENMESFDQEITTNTEGWSYVGIDAAIEAIENRDKNFDETDKYLFRLGIFNYLEKVEDDRREVERAISREVGENLWNIL